MIKEINTGIYLNAIDVDHDQSVIATAGNGIRLWDAKTFSPIYLDGGESFAAGSSITDVRFIAPGKLLTTDWGRQTIMWDQKTGSQLNRYSPPPNTRSPVVALAVNSQFSDAVVARADGKLERIDPTTLSSNRSWSIPSELRSAVLDVGRTGCVVVACEDGSIYQIEDVRGDERKNANLLFKLPAQQGRPIALQQDDNEVLLLSSNGNINRIGKLDTKIIQNTSLGITVVAGAWMPGNKTLLALDSDGIVTRYNISENNPNAWTFIKSGTLQRSLVSGAVLTPISQRYAMVGNGTNNVVFDTNAMSLVSPLVLRNSGVAVAAVAQSGRLILAGTDRGELRLYQRAQASLETIAPIGMTKLPFRDIRFAAFSRDGKSIRVGSITGEFLTLDSTTLVPIGKVARLPPYGMASSTRSHDRELAAVGGWRGEVVLLDSQTGEPTKLRTAKDTGKANALGFSSDQDQLAVGGGDGVLRLYQISDERLLWKSDELGAPINEVALSNDGRFVVASTGDFRRYNEPGKTVLFDRVSGKMLHTWDDSTAMVVGVAFSPDSKKVVACSNDALHLYDVESKAVLLADRTTRRVKRIRFLDNVRFAVSMEPGKILVWDIDTLQAVAHYVGHEKPAGEKMQPIIWGMDVSEDGKRLVTGDMTGQLYVWPIVDLETPFDDER